MSDRQGIPYGSKLEFERRNLREGIWEKDMLEFAANVGGLAQVMTTEQA